MSRLERMKEEAKAARERGDKETLRELRQEYSRMRMFEWMYLSKSPPEFDELERLLEPDGPEYVQYVDEPEPETERPCSFCGRTEYLSEGKWTCVICDGNEQ